MSCWLTIPSCRPGGGTIPEWAVKGYKIAVIRQNEPIQADIQILTDRYLGWARSINILVATVLAVDPLAEYCIGGGDDTLPDPRHAPEEIAHQLTAHFGGTFGICQFTGDRWTDTAESRAQFGEDRGAVIDRIAGSPWIGREYCERAYGGNGPLFAGHHHCWADEEAQLVAEHLGVFWQRRDLTHLHQHWLRDNNNLTGRTDEPQSWAIASKDYMQGRALFEERKRLNFPGSDPL